MEPVVWLPNAAGAIPAPTAAAEPLLDPPGLRSMFHGLRVMEGSPCAKGVVTALPRAIAPAFRKRATHVASSVAVCPLKISVPASSLRPRTLKISLAAKGAPARGPCSSPALRASSTAFAASSAPSVSTCTQAFTLSSHASMRDNKERTHSVAVREPSSILRKPSLNESRQCSLISRPHQPEDFRVGG